MQRDGFRVLDTTFLTDAKVRSDVYTPRRVTVHSPAIEAMTDLQLMPAAVINSEVTIDECQQLMKTRGVRSMLVVGYHGNAVGFVSIFDIVGEKPMELVKERGIKHHELLVADVMRPARDVEVLTLETVLRSEVGHILATLREHGQQHILVLEHDAVTHENFICGIFALSQIAKQLGLDVEVDHLARTFAQIEAAVVAA
jgi:signal-transduction protein with cAMP-binding, CBS, and nucleotidyltransferase domain